MVKFNSVLRLFFALLAGIACVVPGTAQSELLFPGLESSASSFSLANPSGTIAEVEFALFGLDGSLRSVPVNPVRYEIPAGGSLHMSAADVFASSLVGGSDAWVRVSSPVSGIEGTLLDGDLSSNLEGARGAQALEDQIVVVPGRGPGANRTLRVVNPSGTTAPVNVTVFNRFGVPVAATSAALPDSAGLAIDLTALAGSAVDLLSVRVSSSVALVAEVRIVAGGAVLAVNGRSASGDATSLRFAPHVVFGSGSTSTLILANPTGQAVSATVTLYSQAGGGVHPSQTGGSQLTVAIPSNGAVSLGAVQLTGLVVAPTVNGWLQVESPNVPLGATMVVSQAGAASAYPLQAGTAGNARYPRPGVGSNRFMGLALINPAPTADDFELVLVDVRGRTLARTVEAVNARSKRALVLGDVFDPELLSIPGELVVVSGTEVRSVGITGRSDSTDLAIVEPAIVPTAGEFGAVVVDRPGIAPSLVPEVVRPGDRITLITSNVGVDAVLLFGDRVVLPEFTPFSRLIVVDVPALEPGYVDLRVRSAGLESDPVSLLVGPLDSTPFIREVRSRAFYQKIVSGRDGLDLGRPVAVPVRGARVEVYDAVTGDLFSVATTDETGSWRAPAPASEGYAARVLSMASPDGVTVADNTAGAAVYAVGVPLGVAPPLLVALDEGRTSGAFNILEVMRRANRLLLRTDPQLSLPELTIYWSPRNTRSTGNPAAGAIGGTFFDTGSGTAFVLGDRQADSDEFDDSVILHEYAHMLAARFSRDDSMGGAHVPGDVLDPRVAWSEGWANFFSAFVLEDPVYRDTFDADGSATLEYDLDTNFIPGDAGGYWSEFSVHALLWDLVDADGASGDDAVELEFRLVWEAFRQLASDRFVYTPTFLDRLTALAGGEVGSIEQLARSRTIDYQSSAEPTVSNPFPRQVPPGVPVTGEVDSVSRGRGNLANSAHLYAFEFGGGAASIKLEVTGLGPGSDPHANDLDLFLMDRDGNVRARSDRGLNGQSELISTFLPAGLYVVEVRSYYKRAETGTVVFNSGAYRLTVIAP